MSLDVNLERNNGKVIKTCPECGHKREVEEIETVFDANITHNLGSMAEEAGIYKHCWNPEEIGITEARQLIEPLEKAIAMMKADPKRFEAFNSPNGWGLYEHFVPWLEQYLEACKQYPDATIRVSV